MLSPTLFNYNLFINGLIEEIKKLGLGVKCMYLGLQTFPKLQNKAIISCCVASHSLHSWGPSDALVGVGKYCPVDLLEGVLVPCRHQFEMLCLATMDDSRLTKKILKGH